MVSPFLSGAFLFGVLSNPIEDLPRAIIVLGGMPLAVFWFIQPVRQADSI
jgi:hypothetical protein